jgi:hypothetical protein
MDSVGLALPKVKLGERKAGEQGTRTLGYG